MTLPASGVISMTDLQNAFGGPTPIALENYYAGGGLVPNPPPTSAFQVGGPIPTSGLISLMMFLGTDSEFVFNDVISSNRTGGYNLRSAALAAGWNGTSKLRATVQVNGGVFLVGGFNTDSGYPSGSSLRLNNYGILVGSGGVGGSGNGGNGGNGSPALIANFQLILRNSGWICGGGGGGGSGVSHDGWKDNQPNNYYAGGGGGGGGAGFGPGGPGADSSSTEFTYADGIYAGAPGGSGDWQYGGPGGAGAGDAGYGGRGGHLAGFGWGGGLPGSGGWVFPGAGGAPGEAIIGGSNITWAYDTGILGGTVDNFGNTDLAGFTGAGSAAMGNSYCNVIFSYPRNTPMGDTVWWPTASDGQGTVTYTFATLVTNTSIYPMSVRLRGSIDDAVTGVRVNGASAIIGNTLGLGNVSFSPSFNLQPGINLVEILCSNLYNNSPAWMCIELQKTSTGAVLVPRWGWRQP